MAQSNRLIDLSQRLYETAVKLYPAPFRADYEPEIIWLFNRMCQDAFAQAGYPALAAVWLRTIPDFTSSLCEQHWQTWRRDTMENDTKLLRLIASINVSVIGLLAILALGWGIFALGFHRNGLLARPAVTVFWSTYNFDAGAYDADISEFIVYRAAANEETICSALPPEAYHVIPQDNLRSGGIGAPENKSAVWYELKDNYHMKRGDLFCYQVVGMTDAGVTKAFIHNKAAVPRYNWGLITLGVLAAVVGMGLIFLVRQTLRLAGKLAEPVTAA